MKKILNNLFYCTSEEKEFLNTSGSHEQALLILLFLIIISPIFEFITEGIIAKIILFTIMYYLITRLKLKIFRGFRK